METQASTVPSRPFNLQARVKAILAKPRQEWPVVAAEPRDIAGLYSKYIVPLAAIPAVCRLIGSVIVGVPVLFSGTYRVGIGYAITYAIVEYVLTLVGVYVSAFVVAKLAPSFQSEPDVAQAAKLIAYSWTPAWIAGVLMLVPALAPLATIAALYGIYLIYLGVGPVMKTPADKAIVYLVASAIVLIVVYFVIGMITLAILGTGYAVGSLARPTI